MALAPCPECGTPISKKARACPSCGATVRRTSLLTKALAVFFGATLVLSIVAAIDGDEKNQAASSAEAQRRAALSPEQRNAEDAATTAAKAADELRFMRAQLAATRVKRSLKDPDSLQWEYIYTNDDASVVCLRYRAKNSFGGYAIENTTLVGDTFSQAPAAWNKHCAGTRLHDLTYARRGI